MISNKQFTYILLFLIIISVFTINLLSFERGHNWGDDFAAYIDQAKSLVERSYQELFSANKFRFDNSTQRDTGPIFYPWGFPLLLSPVYYIFGLDIYIMKVYVNLFFLTSLIIIFFLFKDSLSNVENLLLISIIGFSKWFFEFKEGILSDVPYMFFSLLSLLLIKKIIIKREILINKYISYLLIGLSISISFNIRSNGFLLLPALVFTQFVEGRHSSKKIKDIILDRFNIIPYIVFLLVNVLIIYLLPRGGSGYLTSLSITNITTIVKNILYYIALPARFFPFLHLWVSYSYYTFSKFSLLFYSMMFLLVIFGMTIRFRKDYLYIFYLLINLAILIYWPHRQGFRFIIPIFPFFLYFLFIGLSKIDLLINISEKLKPLKINMAILFGTGLLLISLAYFSQALYQSIGIKKTSVEEGPYSPESIELFDYIRKNTKEDEAIIFFKPRALHLYTGRRSLVINKYNFEIDQLSSLPANYIVFNKKRYLSSELAIEDLNNKPECVFENKAFILCKLK
jgi:hypothetical protein